MSGEPTEQATEVAELIGELVVALGHVPPAACSFAVPDDGAPWLVVVNGEVATVARNGDQRIFVSDMMVAFAPDTAEPFCAAARRHLEQIRSV